MEGRFSLLRSLLPLKFQVFRSSDSTLEIPSHPHPAPPSPPALSLPHLIRFNLRSHAEIFPTGVDCPHESPHFLASEILQPPKSYNHQGNGALLPGIRLEPLSMFYCMSSNLEFQVAATRPLFEFMPARPNVVFTLAFDQHGLLGTCHVLGGGWGYPENQPQALPSGNLPAGWKDKPQTHSKRTSRKQGDCWSQAIGTGRCQASCGQCVKAW